MPASLPADAPAAWPFGTPPDAAAVARLRADDSPEAAVGAVRAHFRAPGRRVVWRDDAGAEVAGHLLEDGLLCDARTAPAAWTPGAVRRGSLADATTGGAIAPEGARLVVELRSPRLGLAARLADPDPRGLAACRAEADATRAWIAEALGPSEFAWDTLAVTRSMLRPMVGALLFDGRGAFRARLVLALLGESGAAPAARLAAAAMAEYDGAGKTFSADYFLDRPDPLGGAPLRALLQRHLLVCIGRFLSNYKRRFLIQNALGLATAERLRLHQGLIVGDNTEEARRAVWIDWSRAEGGRAAATLTRATWRKNARDLAYVEECDAAVRLWGVVAGADAGAVARLRGACEAACEAEALAREAAAYRRLAALAPGAEEADPVAAHLAASLRCRPSWMLAAHRDGAGPDPATAPAAAWADAAALLEAEAAALRAGFPARAAVALPAPRAAALVRVVREALPLPSAAPETAR